MSYAKFDYEQLAKGIDGLLSDALSYMSGSADRLNEDAKQIYNKNMRNSAKLYRASKRNDWREWFTPDGKKWYLTNKWKVPNSIWSARTFIDNKKNQLNSIMQKDIGTAKQKEIDGAIEYAVSNFK